MKDDGEFGPQLQDLTPSIAVVPSQGGRAQSGETYVFLKSLRTRGDAIHAKGTLAHVHDRTREAPHDEIGEHGNLWIRTDLDLSIWSTFESCIGRGLLEKVEP